MRNNVCNQLSRSSRMRWGRCSSSATSSSRRSPTCAPRWRRPRRPAVRAGTGSPGSGCGGNLRARGVTVPELSHSPPCRIRASARRRRAAKTRTRPPPRPPAPLARARSKTSSGPCSTRYRGKGSGCGTKRNSCAGS